MTTTTAPIIDVTTRGPAEPTTTIAPGGATSFTDYLHRIRLQDPELKPADLAGVVAGGIDAPIPPSWPDPDEVRVSRGGSESGVFMVWESSPYGPVAISTTDIYSKTGGSFQELVDSLVANFDASQVEVGDVDGVIVTSDYARAVYFMRGAWTVAIEVDIAVAPADALEFASQVLEAP